LAVPRRLSGDEMRVVCIRILTALGVSAALGLATLAAQQSQQPVFSSRTWLVPIDVRVVDSGGRPIPGLTASDFTVTEDNVPQQVAHFSGFAMTPEPMGAVAPLRRENETPKTIETLNRRVFLIVLGRGRLQPPAKGVDAAITFVRERMLPQDQVAVTAWNRATDFTTNRERLVAVLERFREKHEWIEAEIRHYFSGFSGAYKGPELPAYIQKDIDRIFMGDDVPPMREMVPGRASETSGAAAEARRSIDEMNRIALLKDREAALAALGKSLSTVDRVALERSTEATWMNDIAAMTPYALSVYDYAGEGKRTLAEMDRLASAIDYLRFVEGEKHIIYICEQGMFLPRLDTDLSLAAAANNARVTLNIIQTGGQIPPRAPMSAYETQRRQGSGNAGAVAAVLSAVGPEPMVARLVASSVRNLAELTGGMASLYDFADKGLSKIANATTSGYLLGYYSTNTAFDGRFRRIKVTVKKPGATVLYRHGYLATAPMAPMDRRRSITYARIVSAVNSGPLNDIPFSLKTGTVKGANRVPDFVAEITVDPSRVGFSQDGGVQAAQLDVAIFCQDDSDDPTGDLWQRINIRLSAAEWESAKRAGVTLTFKIPVKSVVKSVKVIVYDFASDRLGSTTRLLR
jgi:VWFA-related protein